MKLSELSDWQLNEIDKLAKVTRIEYDNDGFEFWSGVAKLGMTKLKPFAAGFTVSERYDTFVVKKVIEYDSLIDYFYTRDGNYHTLFRKQDGQI